MPLSEKRGFPIVALIVLFLIAGALADSHFATKQDLDHQTDEIQNTIEDAHRSVKKYTVQDVTAELKCNAESDYRENRYNRSSVSIEYLDQVQEFNDGHVLIVNGFEADNYDSPQGLCRERYSWYKNITDGPDTNEWNLDARMRLNYVDLNLSVYEDSGLVHSESRNCGVWAYADHPTDEMALSHLVDEAYERCFEVRR